MAGVELTAPLFDRPHMADLGHAGFKRPRYQPARQVVFSEETYRRQAPQAATKRLIRHAISSSSVQSIIGATLIFLSKLMQLQYSYP